MIPITEIELNEVQESLEPTNEIRAAIQLAYPFDDGQMVVRHVKTTASISWYRVNWYRERGNGRFIDRSRFLAIRKTPQGIRVEDQTLTAPPKRFSNN